MITKEEIEKHIEKFRSTVHVPEIVVPANIENILNQTRQQLSAKSREDIGYDMFELSQYAFYITMAYNKLKTTLAWCEGNLRSIIGRELDNTSGYGYNEKSLKIIRNDPNASKIDQIKILTEVKINSIENIERRIEFMSQSLRNILFSKEQTQ